MTTRRLKEVRSVRKHRLQRTCLQAIAFLAFHSFHCSDALVILLDKAELRSEQKLICQHDLWLNVSTILNELLHHWYAHLYTELSREGCEASCCNSCLQGLHSSIASTHKEERIMLAFLYRNRTQITCSLWTQTFVVYTMHK